MRSFRIAVAVASCLLVQTTVFASDRKVIGEWSYKIGTVLTHNIRITQSDDQFFQLNTFQDGSSFQSELVELKPRRNRGRRFKTLESSSGEYCVINVGGNLELYDREGFIREVEKVTQPPRESR